MKFIVAAFLIGASAQVLATNLELRGAQAESLFAALPQELISTRPGAVEKIAREVGCSAMAAGPGKTHIQCSLSTSRLELIKMSPNQSKKLFDSLPVNSAPRPGAMTKTAAEIVCSAMAAGPGRSSYRCFLTL